MPRGLKRYYGNGDLHFITGSCYRRKPLLGSPRAREIFLRVLEQVRRRYKFEVFGYVVMPEHFHILIGEPGVGTPSTVLQVLKQSVAQRLLSARQRRTHNGQPRFWREDGVEERRHFWQARFYDFNVFSNAKLVEKLRYMHRNPVKRGLVASPELWAWSSYRAYAFGEEGMVKIECLDLNPKLRTVKK